MWYVTKNAFDLPSEQEFLKVRAKILLQSSTYQRQERFVISTCVWKHLICELHLMHDGSPAHFSGAV
jgi:hypothetical protein